MVIFLKNFLFCLADGVIYKYRKVGIYTSYVMGYARTEDGNSVISPGARHVYKIDCKARIKTGP